MRHRIDLANQYADAFMEYRVRRRTSIEFGVIVSHPRTGNPIGDPYLVIRDRAKKAAGDGNVQCDQL
jgi:hypothetical protein